MSGYIIENKCKAIKKILVTDLNLRSNNDLKNSEKGKENPNFVISGMLMAVLFFSLLTAVVFIFVSIPGLINLATKKTDNVLNLGLPDYASSDEQIKSLRQNIFEYKTEFRIFRVESADETVLRKISDDRLVSISKNNISLTQFIDNFFFKKVDKNKNAVFVVGGFKSQREFIDRLIKNKIKPAIFVSPALVTDANHIGWEELKIYIQKGATVEATGNNYTKLSTLPIEEQSDEILKSKAKILEMTLSRSTVFFYPFGGYNTQTKNALKANEFLSAITQSECNLQDLENTFELCSETLK